MTEDNVGRLAELIRTRQPCVVLTGAGISTESGIPDFRSSSGIWADYDPMEYATISAFRRDPAKVWDFYTLRFGAVITAEPNAGHLALAELERERFVEAVITQNIDGLHQRAGSQDVVEVHGSIRTVSCLECGHHGALDPASRNCPLCGVILKPDVVMFGELLPVTAIERSVALVQQAGLLLVVGSSLEVYPVAALAEEAATLAILNRDPTPFDGRAVVRVDRPAGETLRAVRQRLA
jgi:NAD-dependent deacetylase